MYKNPYTKLHNDYVLIPVWQVYASEKTLAGEQWREGRIPFSSACGFPEAATVGNIEVQCGPLA